MDVNNSSVADVIANRSATRERKKRSRNNETDNIRLEKQVQNVKHKEAQRSDPSAKRNRGN